MQNYPTTEQFIEFVEARKQKEEALISDVVERIYPAVQNIIIAEMAQGESSISLHYSQLSTTICPELAPRVIHSLSKKVKEDLESLGYRVSIGKEQSSYMVIIWRVPE